MDVISYPQPVDLSRFAESIGPSATSDFVTFATDIEGTMARTTVSCLDLEARIVSLRPIS